MKTWKKITLGLGVMGIACAAWGSWLYHKKPADTRKEKAAVEINATELVAAFNEDEAAASAKYIDKTIAVKGRVASIKADGAGEATVFLKSADPMATVSCSFYREEVPSISALQPGTAITIKGKCTGKLMDVVLNKCSLQQ